jgi:hypothetical protein
VVGASIVAVSISEQSHELAIEFAGGELIRATPDSDEYESWLLLADSEWIVVGPGSEWSVFPASGR